MCYVHTQRSHRFFFLIPIISISWPFIHTHTYTHIYILERRKRQKNKEKKMLNFYQTADRSTPMATDVCIVWSFLSTKNQTNQNGIRRERRKGIQWTNTQAQSDSKLIHFLDKISRKKKFRFQNSRLCILSLLFWILTKSMKYFFFFFIFSLHFTYAACIAWLMYVVGSMHICFDYL